MIASVEGKLLGKTKDSVIVEVAGLGMQLFVSKNTLESMPPVGKKVRLFSHLYVRDDALQLYGFSTALEKELFVSLLGVTGVGPRLALAVLSTYVPENFFKIIATGDLEAVTAIPGVGRKSGQRLLIELKDKLGSISYEGLVEKGLPGEDLYRDAREALRGLGYSQQEVLRALEGFQPDGDSVSIEDLLRHALSRLAKEAR